MSREALAQIEANLIRTKLTGRLPLRLHVVGDAATDQAASILAAACAEHTAKHRQPAWTYTHAWAEVSRESWGRVSVFASCETADDVRQATARGYAVAIAGHGLEGELGDFRLLPCRAQTDGKTCALCRLCWRADQLRAKQTAIVFEVHGSKKRLAETKIQSLRAAI
jgi:hypothetical protein